VLEGRGIGSALARGVLDTARALGLKVVPICPFVKAFMDRHPEYDDLRQ
jgi:predicted GNAT family acetyltransferase